MDPTLVGLLILFLAGSALTYHFGCRRPPAIMRWRIQGGFVVFTFMLIPVAVYVLSLQAGAVDRLVRLGIRPLPGIVRVVGIAAGQGERPVWGFAAEGAGAHDLAFYDDPATRPGWEKPQRGPMMLILVREGRRMSVTLSETWRARSVIYLALP
jgi:hypothetical protein